MADESMESLDPPAPPDGPVDMSQLIAAYAPNVYRYAYRLCGSASDAEDLTQQTFLVACQRGHQLRDRERALAWLFAILRTAFLKSRRKSRPLAAADCEVEMEAFAGPLPDADEIDRERLQAALDALPDEQKLILMLFYFEERSYKEIAEALDVPIGTVMSRLSRAKERLRRELAQRQQGPAGQPSQVFQRPAPPAPDGGANVGSMIFRLR